jgi:hypothetical protein
MVLPLAEFLAMTHKGHASLFVLVSVASGALSSQTKK